MTKTTNNIIAVPGLAGDSLGAIAYWRLSGPVDLDALRAAWVAAGLDETALPVEVSPEVALRMACQEQKQARRLVRPLEDRKGYALVEEEADGDDLTYRPTLLAKVALGALILEPADHPLASEVRAAYARQLSQLAPQAFSGWLVRRVEASAAVALRDTGGLYFVPRYGLARWRQEAAAVRAATGHALFEIPAMRSDEAIAAVGDALNAEAETELGKIREQLSTGDLGARALKSRQETCAALRRKISGYAQALGVALDGLEARVGDLDAELVVATLAAEAEEDARRAAK